MCIYACVFILMFLLFCNSLQNNDNATFYMHYDSSKKNLTALKKHTHIHIRGQILPEQKLLFNKRH